MTDAAEQMVPLTDAQRAALEPYRQAVQQAQAALAGAFGLLVTGAGVDLSTHAARLADDGLSYVVTPREAVE